MLPPAKPGGSIATYVQWQAWSEKAREQVEKGNRMPVSGGRDHAYLATPLLPERLCLSLSLGFFSSGFRCVPWAFFPISSYAYLYVSYPLIPSSTNHILSTSNPFATTKPKARN
jgi:hypothetical protein